MSTDDQTPAHPPSAHVPKDWRSPERRYAPSITLARIVVGLLAALIVLDTVGIAALQARISLVDQLRNGDLPTASQMVSADDHVSVASGAWVVGLIATAVIFIWWFQRLYGNLVALGASDLRYTHGWSIGAWFVPFLNLARPAQIANDIWQASDPSLSPSVGPDWRTGKRSRIVGLWWAGFIVSGLVDRVAASRPTGTLDQIVSSDRFIMASNLVDAIAAAIAIVFVLQLTRRQRTRAAAVASATV